MGRGRSVQPEWKVWRGLERSKTGRRTLLGVNLGLDEQVDAHDDQVAEKVETAAGVEHIGIFEGDPLGHLHHTQDDDDVGSICDGIMSVLHMLVLVEAVACDEVREGQDCCNATHTWGPRPAILNGSVEKDEETEEMETVGEGCPDERRSGSRPDSCWWWRVKQRSGLLDGDAPGKVVVDRYLWQWPGELGSPEVWPLQLFCGKKPPQRPTAWGGSVGGSAACDWLYT